MKNIISNGEPMLGVSREEMIDFIAKAIAFSIKSFVPTMDDNMLKIIRQMATEYTDEAIESAKEKKE